MYSGIHDETKLIADAFRLKLAAGRPYSSPVLDSGSDDTVWGRMVLEVSDDTNLKVSVRIGNDKSLYDAKRVESEYTDLLLYTEGANGRFLQFDADGTGTLYGYRIYYPKVDFTDYLPRIYRGNEYLTRFLSVFSESYIDIEREIDQFEKELNPLTCKTENLAMLARIIGGEIFLEPDEKARRNLLRYSGLLYQWRGTANALRLAVYLTAGEMPAIIERDGQVDIMLTDAANPKLPVLKKIARQFVPYPLNVKFIFPASDAVLEQNGYLGYCRCAEKKQAVIGEAALGEMICL